MGEPLRVIAACWAEDLSSEVAAARRQAVSRGVLCAWSRGDSEPLRLASGLTRSALLAATPRAACTSGDPAEEKTAAQLLEPTKGQRRQKARAKAARRRAT